MKPKKSYKYCRKRSPNFFCNNNSKTRILTREIKLTTIFGIEISLDYSWFVIFFLITLSFATNLLPQIAPGKSTVIYLLYGLLGAIIFFLSVILHEISHTLTAKRNNLPIKKITLFLFGGASNLLEEPPSAAVEFKMAVVGPLSSIIIGALLIGAAEIITLRNTSSSLAPLINVLGFLNFGLAVFNLLPGFPLDGGRILRSFLWWQTNDLLRSTKIAVTVSKGIAILLGLWGGWIAATSGFGSGLWIIIISIFLYQSATFSYIQTLISAASKTRTKKQDKK